MVSSIRADLLPKFSMRYLGLWAILLASPASAWNATGHRIIAAIAYARLTPEVRARVDALIDQHPDYATLFTKDAPADTEGRARAAFIAAAVWPDTIKGDPRFYDDTHADAHPTPLLPGFPDMKRHTNWHYIDIPYAPDGATSVPPGVPNALEEITRLLRDLGNPAVNYVYDLPWLVHLEEDLHQPLHCTSRFLKSQPQGDAGGNLVFVTPGRNLHSVWDDSAGIDTSDAYVTKFATDVIAEHPPPPHLDTDPQPWVDEGFGLAKSDVYTFGFETGTHEHPIQLSATYLENAKRVARARIALAGYRLAAILNEKLK